MLYLIATPIGNLKEITIRALETLKEVDYIACEDTRTSKILLDNYDIKKPLISYHKFNEVKASQDIIIDLKHGKNIALISDAGMPGISDPGNVLVNKLIEENIEYTVISGPSAFTNAFVLSGFPTPFTFVGFLPDNNKKRIDILESFSVIPSTLIFYCSPHSLDKDLKDMAINFGNRDICIVREISKKFEEINFTNLNNGYDGVVKGEFVVLVKPNIRSNLEIDVDKNLKTLLDMGLSKNDASKVIAKITGTKKNEIYQKMVTKEK